MKVLNFKRAKKALLAMDGAFICATNKIIKSLQCIPAEEPSVRGCDVNPGSRQTGIKRPKK